MADESHPTHFAVPPSDAAASVTGTVVGDGPAADVFAAPSALHPDDEDATDAATALTGVELDDASLGSPDPESLPEIDIVSE